MQDCGFYWVFDSIVRNYDLKAHFMDNAFHSQGYDGIIKQTVLLILSVHFKVGSIAKSIS